MLHFCIRARAGRWASEAVAPCLPSSLSLSSSLLLTLARNLLRSAPCALCICTSLPSSVLPLPASASPGPRRRVPPSSPLLSSLPATQRGQDDTQPPISAFISILGTSRFSLSREVEGESQITITYYWGRCWSIIVTLIPLARAPATELAWLVRGDGVTGRLGRAEIGSALKTRHLAPFVDPSADLSHFAFRALPAGCRDPFVSQSFPRHWSFIRPRTGDVSSAYGCRPRRSSMHGIRTLFRLPVFFVSPFFVSIFCFARPFCAIAFSTVACEKCR